MEKKNSRTYSLNRIMRYHQNEKLLASNGIKFSTAVLSPLWKVHALERTDKQKRYQ